MLLECTTSALSEAARIRSWVLDRHATCDWVGHKISKQIGASDIFEIQKQLITLFSALAPPVSVGCHHALEASTCSGHGQCGWRSQGWNTFESSLKSPYTFRNSCSFQSQFKAVQTSRVCHCWILKATSRWFCMVPCFPIVTVNPWIRQLRLARPVLRAQQFNPTRDRLQLAQWVHGLVTLSYL